MNDMITLFDARLVHSPSVNQQAPSRDWASKISRLVNQPSSPFGKCAHSTSVNSITPSNSVTATATATTATTITITLIEYQSLFPSTHQLSINQHTSSCTFPLLHASCSQSRALTSHRRFAHMNLIAYSHSISIHCIRTGSQFDAFRLWLDDLAILILQVMILFTADKSLVFLQIVYGIVGQVAAASPRKIPPQPPTKSTRTKACEHKISRISI